MNGLREAIDKFSHEVEEEAIRLIEAGQAAPYEAVDIARRNVLKRRAHPRWPPVSPTESHERSAR